MGRPKVSSREYKVMLRPARFAGDEARVLAAAGTLWKDLVRGVRGVVLGSDGVLSRIETRRLITFLDTARHDLHQASYVFRERRDLEGGEREVTLKCRHPDRYVVQKRDMAAAGARRARTKLEEDIKVPFISLYARAGIREYWIVNLAERLVEVYRDPVPAPSQPYGWSYGSVSRRVAADSLTPLFAPAARVLVADLLP
jgi:hypothetical protein